MVVSHPFSRPYNVHLELDEFQIALKWWLGMDTSLDSCCPHCPNHQLDHLGHHAVICKGGGDVVLCHNCHRVHLGGGGGGQIEVGYGLGTDKRHSRPADILTSG